MIFIKFGIWNYSAGKYFRMKRILWKGYKWTPFVKISWRYKNKFFGWYGK